MTDFHKKYEELSNYGSLENTEQGEAWTYLAELFYRSEYLGDENAKIIEKMVDQQLAYISENTEIVESSETVTRNITVVELVWK